jgi:hypothetical protein
VVGRDSTVASTDEDACATNLDRDESASETSIAQLCFAAVLSRDVVLVVLVFFFWPQPATVNCIATTRQIQSCARIG